MLGVEDKLRRIQIVERLRCLVVHDDERAVAGKNEIGDADDGRQAGGEVHEEMFFNGEDVVILPPIFMQQFHGVAEHGQGFRRQ